MTEKIIVDDLGVKSEYSPGIRSAIDWDQISAVIAYKIDAKSAVLTYVTFDTQYGEYVEVLTETDGFDQLVSELPKRLSGLAADWFDRVRDL